MLNFRCRFENRAVSMREFVVQYSIRRKWPLVRLRFNRNEVFRRNRLRSRICPLLDICRAAKNDLFFSQWRGFRQRFFDKFVVQVTDLARIVSQRNEICADKSRKSRDSIVG